MFTAILAIVRHVLTAGGAALATNGLLESSEVEAAVGAVVTVLATVWSIIEKARAKKALEKAIAAPAGKAE